ncbi:hypothetical protein C0993_007741 [Termitomyces sp. T159_Od127]|nr:hypothetical protein C0993_007741 [Termitomyces sp. T159_Od127]
MLAFRTFFALAAAAVAIANPLRTRQDTNTNSAIHDIVSTLDEVVHVVMPTVLLLQANQTDTDGTIGAQVNTLITAFNTAESALAATPVSSGSTTVIPTNDDISILFADVMSILASGLSGLPTASSVPSFASDVSRLDPSVAGTINQFNITLPGSVILVHTMMLDAQQFLVQEGAFPQTVAALGF